MMLLAVAGFFAACAYMVLYRFYGMMIPVPLGVPILLIAMAMLCLGLSWHIRTAVENNRIGIDLHPLRAAAYHSFAQASQWTAAIIGGVYFGMGCYVVPRAPRLTAAADDAPVVIAAVLSAVALYVAGRRLERNCKNPPNAVG